MSIVNPEAFNKRPSDLGGLLQAADWGDAGRLAHVMDGMFMGRIVLVWPQGDKYWFALDRPVEGHSDLRFVSRDEAAELAKAWGLEWIPKSRQEARLEARLFGIRPEMDPANRAFLPVEDEAHVEPISRAVSPGARWIAFPTHLFFSSLLFIPLLAREQMEDFGAFNALFVLVGAISLLLAFRAWFLRIVITDREVIVHEWLRTQRFDRNEVAGFAVGEYHGGLLGMYWSTYDHNFASIRTIMANGDVIAHHAVFAARARRLRTIANSLDAHINPSSGSAPGQQEQS